METTGHAGIVLGEGNVIGLVGGGHPCACLGAVIQHDLFGQAHAQTLLEKHAGFGHIQHQQVQMVDPAGIAAAGGIFHRLIFQCGPERFGSLIPFGVVIEFDRVAIGRAGAIGRAVAEIAIGPADTPAFVLQDFDAAFECFLAHGAPRHMAHARGAGGRKLQRMEFVIIPAAQIDAVALAPAFGQAQHIDKEMDAFGQFGGEHLDMAEMGNVMTGFGLFAHCALPHFCYWACFAGMNQVTAGYKGISTLRLDQSRGSL